MEQQEAGRRGRGPSASHPPCSAEVQLGCTPSPSTAPEGSSPSRFPLSCGLRQQLSLLLPFLPQGQGHSPPFCQPPGASTPAPGLPEPGSPLHAYLSLLIKCVFKIPSERASVSCQTLTGVISHQRSTIQGGRFQKPAWLGAHFEKMFTSFQRKSGSPSGCISLSPAQGLVAHLCGLPLPWKAPGPQVGRPWGILGICLQSPAALPRPISEAAESLTV